MGFVFEFTNQGRVQSWGIEVPTAGTSYGFVYTTAGNFVGGPIYCGGYTVIEAVNNNGDMVGGYEYNGVKFSLAGATCLPFSYPNSFQTVPGGINDAGQISGSWNTSGGTGYGFYALPQ